MDRWRPLLAAGLLVTGCQGREPPREIAITITAKPGVDPNRAVWEPAAPVRRVDRSPRGVTLTLDASALPDSMEIRAPGGCPVKVPLRGVKAGERRSADLVPWIDLGEDRPQVGFDAAFEIEVRPGCREAVAGRITWRIVDGAKLPSMREEKNGFRLRARTPRLAETRSGSMAWGIVPWSPSSRGAVTLEATWQGVGPTTTRRVHVAAVARASGVPSLAIGQRVMLGGSGWRVKDRPPNGRAGVMPFGEMDSFTADASGRWVLEDGAGLPLSLRAGRHAETPLDCGRAECHASAAEGASHTRMTSVLANGLRGAFGKEYDAGCAIACHAVGEPGLRDGGFADVARELFVALPPPAPEAWESLPRPLRRLGGVGCTACHGPGAIPERASRWTILRTDVCATCHDAPPRYGHVAAYRANKMSRADAAPETRKDGKCRACHTTAGFLDAIGVRASAMSDGGPDEPRGIGCAACHAAHAADSLPRQVRRIAPPASLGDVATSGASTVCLRCHAPLADDVMPSASAASLWLGRVSKDDPQGPAPHANVQNGCLGCHAGGDPEALVERGAGHAFRVDRSKCEPCHDCPKKERSGRDGKLVRERAQALFAILRKKKIVESAGDEAPHAAIAVRAAPGSNEARAALRVLLVLEDRAAGAHNGPHARMLLDEAEASLAKAR